LAISKRLRYEIFQRDRFTCGYCGRSAPDVLLELEHVIPRAAGGGDEPSNLRAACEDCNDGKADRMPGRWQIAAVKKIQREWLKNGRRHPREDDLSDMYAYMDAFAYLQGLPSARILNCIAHVLATTFPFRPYGPELIIAAAALASEGYGSERTGDAIPWP
jgi:HNH endonuclease